MYHALDSMRSKLFQIYCFTAVLGGKEVLTSGRRKKSRSYPATSTCVEISKHLKTFPKKLSESSVADPQ